MHLLVSLIGGIAGGLILATAYGIHALWWKTGWSMDSGLLAAHWDPFWKYWAGAGAVVALGLLAGGYQGRRIVVALVAGVALALLILPFVSKSGLNMTHYLRPDRVVNASFFVALALWFAFAEPMETMGGSARDELQLRVIAIVGLVVTTYCLWRMEETLRMTRFVDRAGIVPQYFPVFLIATAAMLLCWLSRERYFLAIPDDSNRTPDPFLRRNAQEWKKPKVLGGSSFLTPRPSPNLEDSVGRGGPDNAPMRVSPRIFASSSLSDSPLPTESSRLGDGPGVRTTRRLLLPPYCIGVTIQRS